MTHKRRYLTIVVCIVLIITLTAANPATGFHDTGDSTVLLDDFEDGDFVTELHNWDNWTSGTGIGIVAGIEGDHSIQVEKGFGSGRVNSQITRSNPIQVEEVTFLVQYSLTDCDNFCDGDEAGIKLAGGAVAGMEMDVTGDLEHDGQQSLSTGGASPPYKVRFHSFNYSDNTFHIEINGTDNGPFAFETNGDEFTTFVISASTTNSNDNRVGVRVDSIEIYGNPTKGYNVTGTITDKDGNVLTGIDVTVNDSQVSDTSDVVGDYGLQLPNGTYKITAGGTTNAGETYEDNSTIIEVNGSDVSNVDLRLNQTHKVNGKVTEQGTTGSLNGIGNVTISTNKSSRSTQTVSDGTGSYSLNLTSGTHEITASHPFWFNETKTVTISGDSTINFELEKVEADISGHVTASNNGSVIENADITVSSTNDQTATNANGFYEIGPLEKGTYTITADKAGYASNSITVTVDKNTVSKNDKTIESQDIQLTPEDRVDYTVNGTVTNQSGTPILNVNIDVIGESVSTTTDNNGDYEVTLTNGDYTIEASHNNYFDNSISVSVDNANVTNADITLETLYGNVSGQVINSQTGNLVEGADVTANTTNTVVTTDSNGNYELTLEKGVHEITATKASYSVGSIIVTVDKNTVSDNDREITNQDISISVDDSGVTVNGRVTDYATDSGVSGVTITTNQSAASAITDSNGNFEIIVSNGTHILQANKSGYHNDSKTVTYSEGENINNENFVVLEKGLELELDIPRFFDHGETKSYRVYYGDSLVTSKSSVTSNNTTVLTIDQSSQEATSTSNENINTKIQVNAEFFGSEYTDTVNVTVANETIKNIDIIPPENYIPAFLGFGQDQTLYGIGSTIQWALLAIIIGAMATGITRNEWLGLGVGLMGLIVAWVLGHIGLGLMLGGFSYAIFAGLVLLEVPSRDSVNVEIGDTSQYTERFKR